MEDDKEQTPVAPNPQTSEVHGEKVIQPVSQDLKLKEFSEAGPLGNLANVKPVELAQVSPEPSTAQTVVAQTDQTNADVPIIPISPSYVPPSPTLFVAGSQMRAEKKPLPTGVYILAGLILLSFVLSFFGSSNVNTIYMIDMVVSLLVAIGLLLRLEVARRIMVWLSGITVVLMVMLFIAVVKVQRAQQDSKAKYEAAVSRLDPAKLTTTQKQALDKLNALIADARKKNGSIIAIVYVRIALGFTESIAIIVYLTRPSVKEAFHELPK